MFVIVGIATALQSFIHGYYYYCCYYHHNGDPQRQGISEKNRRKNTRAKTKANA